MASLPDSLAGCEDYDYPDDFTDISEDHDLPLPGLHAPTSARNRPGGDDWRLPGSVHQSENSSDSGISSGNEDGGNEPLVLVDTRGTRAFAPATVYQREPWMMQLETGAPSPSASDAPGLIQARFAGSTDIGGGMSPFRNSSVTSGRSLFGPFGSSSLQHRDSLQNLQSHPLALTVQHHQHIMPLQPRSPPTPVLPLVQPLTQAPTREQQPQQKDQNRELERSGRAGSVFSGLEDDEDAYDDEQENRADADGDPWCYLDADPFVLAASSSCSSSLSGSRDPSPQPQPAAAQPFSVPGRGNGAAMGRQPQPWYSSQYDDSPLEHDFALGLGPRLRRRSSSVGGTGGLRSRDEDGRQQGIDRVLGSFGLGLDEGPAADNTHGTGGGSDSSHSSWAGRAGLDAGYEGAGLSTSQPAGAVTTVLWRFGDPGDMLLSGDEPRRVGMAADGEPGWPTGANDPRHRHVVGSRASELSPGWRPSQEDEGTEELRPSTAGTSSSALRSRGYSSWDHQYDAGLGDRNSLGLSFGGSSAPAHRYSPRSTLGDSDLSGLGPSPPAPSSGGPRGATPGGLGGYHASGFGRGGGGAAGGNATLCFTSLDSPSGPYDRRRVVLTSAHRRNTEASTPNVRQYSDGLAGMLTNAQIQEWMSQHASRLLLPRHMQEIADIVFRPPSAVPEKKPLKCQPSGVTTLPPPVVLGGRYAPLHISRLAGDNTFMSDLLAGLYGVDPANSRVQAVVTALQSKDVVVAEEGAEGAGEPQGRTVLTKGLRPPSRIQPK